VPVTGKGSQSSPQSSITFVLSTIVGSQSGSLRE